MRRLLLAALLLVSLAGCTAVQSVRLCGLKSLAPGTDCCLKFYWVAGEGESLRLLDPRLIQSTPGARMESQWGLCPE